MACLGNAEVGWCELASSTALWIHPIVLTIYESHWHLQHITRQLEKQDTCHGIDHILVTLAPTRCLQPVEIGKDENCQTSKQL